MTSSRVNLPTRLIIDAHTHIFSPEMIRDRERLSLRDKWFAELYQNPKASLVSESDILSSMDEAGFQCSIVCGFPWRDAGLCREHNDYLLEVAARNPGRIAVVATVPPTSNKAAKEAERCFGAGAVGIGELNADAQGFDLMTPEGFAPLVQICQEFDRPILFHVSEPVGHLYPGKGTSTPKRLLCFLQAFPDLKVVDAHWGGGLPFYELMPEVSQQTRNLVYDSAASTYLYQSRVFPIVAELVGYERVLMGTDYPLLRQGRFVRRLMRHSLPKDALDAILWRNAVRVYGLNLESDVE